MKRIVIRFAGFLPAVLITALCVNGPETVNAQELNSLSKKEKRQGWTLLFDGSSTNGWHTYLKEKAGAAWTVNDEALAFNPGAGERGDLVTDKEFENYELRREWKIAEGGNTGTNFIVQRREEREMGNEGDRTC